MSHLKHDLCGGVLEKAQAAARERAGAGMGWVGGFFIG